MAKLTKVAQKLFGSNAGTDQLTEFGSTFAGSPVYTADIASLMSLSNWLTGWYAAAIGGNAPTIQDMNACHTVFAYQLGYLMQAGVAEWDAVTIYFIGSLVNSGGTLYVSLTDDNVDNALTDPVNWAIQGRVTKTETSGYTALLTDDYIRVDATAGPVTIILPALSTANGKQFKIKKVDSGANVVTIVGNGADLIDFANSYLLTEPGNSVDVRAYVNATIPVSVWDIV